MTAKPYNGFPGSYRDSQYLILKAAWSAGTLERPTRCEACRQTEGTMNAHHEDYSRPLEYDALCCVCHLMVHCRFTAPRAWDRYRRLVAAGWQPPPATQNRVMRLIRRHFLNDPDGPWPGGYVNQPRDRTVLDTYDKPQSYVHPHAERFQEHPRLDI